jgi:hypothetical protein
VKAELTDAIKALTVKSTNTPSGYDAAQYAQAANSLMQALSMLHHMERGDGQPELSLDEVVPEGGTD